MLTTGETGFPTLVWPSQLNPNEKILIDGIEYTPEFTGMSELTLASRPEYHYILKPDFKEVRLLMKAIDDQAMLPSRGYPDDAGLDLFACEDVEVGPFDVVDIPTGVAMELPPGTWGMIVGRSSTLRKRKMLVNMSVIDRGWRGDLFVNVVNLEATEKLVTKGERIGQLIILPNISEGWVPTFVEELSGHARGTKGFGSTGL